MSLKEGTAFSNYSLRLKGTRKFWPMILPDTGSLNLRTKRDVLVQLGPSGCLAGLNPAWQLNGRKFLRELQQRRALVSPALRTRRTCED